MSDVSVTIITKNEANNIKDCLASVQWATEIIVVDCFSVDGTVELARELGAKVFQEQWQGFGRQKNSAIDKAEGSWILSIDADERVPLPLRREIEDVLGRNNECSGYYIARKNFFCGQWIRYGGWYPDYTLRLFRKREGRFKERAVHEMVVVDGKVGHLRHHLEHYTYKSVTDFLERLERYSRLAAQEMSQRKRQANLLALTLRPFYTFVKMYFLKRGFLDGRAGLFLAVSYAYYTFLKYYRLYARDFDRQS
jgi:glycosyltransferase involved in cell wall biosynthesis